MACGAWDRDIVGRVFWMRMLGQAVTAEQVAGMHPLRRLERPRPTAEDQAADSGAGWAVLERGLAHLNRERRG